MLYFIFSILQLAEERKKNIILEQEIIAYRDELKRSFAKIVQLRFDNVELMF